MKISAKAVGSRSNPINETSKSSEVLNHVPLGTRSCANWSGYTAWCVITRTQGEIARNQTSRGASLRPTLQVTILVGASGRRKKKKPRRGEESNPAESISLRSLNPPWHNQAAGRGRWGGVNFPVMERGRRPPRWKRENINECFSQSILPPLSISPTVSNKVASSCVIPVWPFKHKATNILVPVPLWILPWAGNPINLRFSHQFSLGMPRQESATGN